MTGFYLAIGQQGSGKTCLITKLCFDNYQEGVQIYSNYSLFGLPYTKITLVKLLDMLDQDPKILNDSIILIDEIHIYLDSLDFMRKNNRRLQIFFSQLRKRNILLLGTTQYLMNVDIRIRRQCMNVFEMEHIYKDLFEVTTLNIDGYFTEEISRYSVKLDDYYDKYDTNELITQ
jgi:GTPase SAR1 family protein